MQAVILAAGQSSRFFPFGNGKHKSCERLLGRSIIEHTVLSLKKSGITNIIIVTDRQSHVRDAIHEDVRSGITFIEQKEAQGMGDALLQAKDSLADSFFLLHAHHLEFNEFAKAMQAKQEEKDTVVLLARKADFVARFGVLEVADDTVTGITEKPESAGTSSLCVVGIYLLSKAYVDVLSQSPKDHYNFEIALNAFAKKQTVKVVITENETVSLKYAWDLLALNRYLLNKVEDAISERSDIHKTAVITGNVIVEEGAKIMEHVTIKGPCYIGKNAVVGTGAIVRDHATLGEGVFIGAHMEIKNSIVMDKTKTHSGFIGDSVIGSECKIAAQFCTGNVRLDRASVKVKTAKGAEDTGLRSLGVCIGDRCVVGIRVATMPGILIGRDTVIGPSTTVFRHVEANKLYYTRFQEDITESNDTTLTTKEMLIEDTPDEKEKMVLFDIDYTLFDTDIFKQSNLLTYQLYEEVVPMLDELQSVARVGIFSEGEVEFQKAKLMKTKIHEHFPQEHLHIVAKKDETLTEVLDKYTHYRLFYIDDRLTILQKAKEHVPDIFTIWIKRGPYAINQSETEAYKPDATIVSLDGVVAIVANTY